MSTEELFNKFWEDYTEITPVAKVIHDLLTERGESIVNDHIAFRTFAHEGINIDAFEKFFKSYGFIKSEEYNFEQKKLNAIHMEHSSDSRLPKIFISELRYKELSEKCISVIDREISSLSDRSILDLIKQKNIFNISSTEYRELLNESEYASWLCALGFRVNHFTIFVNELKTFKNLEELNSLLLEKNIPLNESGGIIKGSSSEYLEQTSTMANKMDIKFSDKSISVPTCYYEFALRHKLPNGTLFQGFVTTSADKIFESTNYELDK